MKVNNNECKLIILYIMYIFEMNLFVGLKATNPHPQPFDSEFSDFLYEIWPCFGLYVPNLTTHDLDASKNACGCSESTGPPS